MFKQNKKQSFSLTLQLLKGFLFFLFSLFGFESLASGECADAFSPEATLHRSRFLEELRVQIEGRNAVQLHPTHSNLREDIKREELWNSEIKAPSVIQFLLPPDVWLIRHRLPYSTSRSHVQITEERNAVMARARWTHKSEILTSNVVFSKNAFYGNLIQLKETKGTSQKWLVRENARAAILFLHGGGTKTASSNVSTQFLNHFVHAGIDLVALDLPMHAGGPRQFLGIKEDILAFGSFAKKFIPPNVPVFVYGHSWGAVYADELMRMTDQYEDANFFHPSLKGLIIVSPAMDPAPGLSMAEKIEEYIKRSETARELAVNQAPPSENKIFENLIRKGKISPLGSFYATYTLTARNQTIPDHKGEKWMPSLMIIGKGDPLVYLGYEDLVHNYYDNLANVEAHYIEQVYDLFSRKKVTGGHLLSDYVNSLEGRTIPVNIELTEEYIAKRLGLSKKDLTHQEVDKSQYSSLLDIAMLEINNLAFRNWRENFKITISLKLEKEIRKIINENKQQFQNIEHLIIERLPINQFFESLKRMSLVSSRREFEDVQKTLISLEPYYEASFSKEYEVLFERALNLNTWPEASTFARNQFLEAHSLLHKPQEGSININSHFKSKDEQVLAEYLDQIPFKSRQGRSSVFQIPDRIKEKILNLYRTHGDYDGTVQSQIKGEVGNIIVFYTPKNILYNLLLGLSQGVPSRDLRTIKQELKETLDKNFSSIQTDSFYEEWSAELRQLFQAKTFNQFQAGAVALIEKFPALHSQKRIISNEIISAMKQRLNEEAFVDRFKRFFLSEEALDGVSQWYQKRQKSIKPPSVKDLVNFILENSLIEHHFRVDQFLKKITYEHILKQLKKFFKEEQTPQYVESIDNILKASTKGKKMDRAYEAFLKHFTKPFLHGGKVKGQIEKILSLKQNRGGKLEHFLTATIAFPRDIREEITTAYEEYNRVNQYINTLHIPESLDEFYIYYHDKDFKKSAKQDRHYLDLIEDIKKLVHQYREITVKIEELNRRQHELLVEVRKLNANLANYIRLVKDAFNSAESYFLKEEDADYKLLDQKFNTMISSYTEFVDAVDRLAVSAISKNGKIEVAEVVKRFEGEEFKTMLEEVENTYSTWKNFNWHLNNELVPRVLKGELGEQYQKAFEFIYGKNAVDLKPVFGYSQYLQLEDRLKSLAEVDSAILNAKEEQDRVSVEYHQIYPAQTLSMPLRLNVQNLLSHNPQDKKSSSYAMDMIEYIESNIDKFNMTLEYWKNMKGYWPEALPSETD